MGAVGRIVVSGSASENHEMFLDLKGMCCLNAFDRPYFSSLMSGVTWYFLRNHLQNNNSALQNILHCALALVRLRLRFVPELKTLIEAIMNDFIQLKPQSNVYEAETMVEGTLEGFSFDSEDEAEKMPKAIPHQTDQNEDIDGQMNGKSKGRADKTSMVSRKRGKTGGGKSQPAKKARKKAISKKPKAKK
ncbi:hypothetical protein Gohar_006899 [Gossypium harknessii]|uniref:Uncharacterized protein n=1 Tax=Gossypium harknessii TaxID=34285 RepID=A0A7J9GF30_9ROSI|nr:hypothetical protein [Gossypium harknessii]